MKNRLAKHQNRCYIMGKGLQKSFTRAAAEPSLNGTTSSNFLGRLILWTCRMSVLVRCGAQLLYAFLNSCKSFFTGIRISGKDNINAVTRERA